MKKYYFLILTFILLVIALRLFPVIIDRIKTSKIIENNKTKILRVPFSGDGVILDFDTQDSFVLK